MKRSVFILFILWISHSLKGQGAAVPNLAIKTHVYKDGIAIRWTPTNSYYWHSFNKNGYRLERQTIEKGGEPITSGNITLMTGGTIKPISDSIWSEYAKTTPEAGLIQSCISKENQVINDKTSFLSSNEDANQCYVFSMLAMQEKFEFALAAGLGFIDKSISNDEVYLYKLYPVNSESNDTLLFVVDAKELTILPQIQNFSSMVIDDKIRLKWNSKDYIGSYFGYQIEKSFNNGKSYTPINSSPIISLQEETLTTNSFEYYNDTISRYYQKILYRIKGMSYFGQYDIPSIPDTIIAYPETKEFPKALEISIGNDSVGKIKWEFDVPSENLILGFNIFSSDSIDGTYCEINGELIPSDVRNFELKLKNSINYFKVYAISKNRFMRPSFPLMAQLADSFAPNSPHLIQVTVDTNGIATIKWRKNKELDFLGYKLFRSNSLSHEFSSISSNYEKDTFNTDTLMNTFIRDSVYYKLVGYDNRFNESKYSNVIAAAVPNKIPPSPPIISDIFANSSSAIIHWIQSSSSDVDHYILMKYNTETMQQNEILITKDKKEYLDQQVSEGITYFYTIKAMDFTGLESTYSRQREVQIPLRQIMPEVYVKAVASDSIKNRIDIFWEYEMDSAVGHYRIFKLNTDGSMQTIGTAQNGKTFFNYYYQTPFISTQYKIVAYFKNGRRSKL